MDLKEIFSIGGITALCGVFLRVVVLAGDKRYVLNDTYAKGIKEQNETIQALQESISTLAQTIAAQGAALQAHAAAQHETNEQLRDVSRVLMGIGQHTAELNRRDAEKWKAQESRFTGT